MRRVLLTAFGPYDDWRENASWLVLQAVMREFSHGLDLTTRLYPSDFDALRDQVRAGVAEGEPFDASIHLGQAPGRSRVNLETMAVNRRRERGQRSEEAAPLEATGPAAYASRLPLADWTVRLRDEGVPAEVSAHAGDYLCNATLYWAHYFAEQAGRPARSAFVHVPLDLRQAAEQERAYPSMPAELSAYAVRLMLESLADAPAPEGVA